MAALYGLYSVGERVLFARPPSVKTIVSGFCFSMVGEDGGGVGTLLMRAVWGDPSGEPPRFSTFMCHRPERVRALYRDLEAVWRTSRARFVTPGGDDYGDWFVGEFERVLALYRHASDRGEWVTNDHEKLTIVLAGRWMPKALLRALPSPERPPPPERALATSGASWPLGVVSALALGAFGLCAWRRRRAADIERRERAQLASTAGE